MRACDGLRHPFGVREREVRPEPEITLAILPGVGGTQRLARHTGKGRTLEIIMTGRMMDAEEALSAGLVSKVVPQEDLMDTVKDTAEQVLTKGPLAVRLTKPAVQADYKTDQRTGLLIERLAQAILLTSEDKREGTSAFLEKREPYFKGR